MLGKRLTGTLGAGVFALGVAASAAPAQAATHTVVNANDAGNGSLREAIDIANMGSKKDRIKFEIPGPPGHLIVLNSPLPVIVHPVAIDGYSQRDASPATDIAAAVPTIVIDAGNVARGIDIGADGVTVRGLVIRNATADGIFVGGSDNVIAGNHIGTNASGTVAQPNLGYGVQVGAGQNNLIGGPTAEDRNVISSNSLGEIGVEFGDGQRIEGNYLGTDASGTAGLAFGTGVLLETSGNTVVDNLISSQITGVNVEGDENTVQGNLVGTDISGDAGLGNFLGIDVNGGDRNLIGGTAEGDANVVADNLWGVSLSSGADGPAEDNDVQGNLIGTTASGTAPLPNSLGVTINASNDNTIGGEEAGTGNVISGNQQDGVKIESGADDNQVQGNWIGTDKTEALDLGNGESGVEIVDSDENRVGATLERNLANVIAHNSHDGVTVTSGDENAIVRNSIHDNGELGIDLDANGTTPNDGPLDPDMGANTLQNGPQIVQATATAVTWELESDDNTTYRLEFFANDACDASGSGEAQTYLGTIDVTTNGNGLADATTTTAIPAGLGKHVSMTATRLNGASLQVRSTSELSPCELAV